jgi:hypothetical protein
MYAVMLISNHTRPSVLPACYRITPSESMTRLADGPNGHTSDARLCLLVCITERVEEPREEDTSAFPLDLGGSPF